MRAFGSLAFNIVLWGSGAALSLWSALIGRFFQDGILRAAQRWSRISLWALRVFCGITIDARGMEFLPEGGCIIAAQHQSALDILIWLSLVPRPAFVFKRELKRIPLFGAMLEPSGMIPVDRGGGRKTLRLMTERAEAAVASGRQVVIFPEGTRVAHGIRSELRQGIARMAGEIDAPVIPATTDAGLRWGRLAFHKQPGPVQVTLHEKLPKGLAHDEVLAALGQLYYGPLEIVNPETAS